MAINSFKAMLAKAKKGDAYVIARNKLKFSHQIKSLMERNGVSTKDMALKMKCTSANVSKLVNSEGNLRLESMIKLARAAGGEFHFEVKETHFANIWGATQMKCMPAKLSPNFGLQYRTNDGSRMSRVVPDSGEFLTDVA